jgi:hypothetical protein
LPGQLSNYLDKIIPHERLYVRYWDIWTGKLKSESSQRYPAAYVERYLGPYSTFFARTVKMMRDDVLVSSDGRYLAWDQGMVLNVWDTQARRPLLCWLICSALVTLGLWIVWRGRLLRIKQPDSRQTPGPTRHQTVPRQPASLP